MILNAYSKPIIARYWISSPSKGNAEWRVIAVDGKKTCCEINREGIVRDRKTQVPLQQRILNGYSTVQVQCKDIVITLGVHRLMACLFIPIPRELTNQGNDQSTLMPNHIDGVKTHNVLSNLEWITPSGNIQHAMENGLCTNLVGEKSHLAKMTEADARQICELLHNGAHTPNEVAEITGKPIRVVRHIYDGECWKQVSRNYNFVHSNKGPGSLDDSVIHEICKLLEANVKYRNEGHPEKTLPASVIASRCGCSVGYVGDIKRRRRKTDISSQYNF